ncbi:MAG: hypothetical protein VX335_05470, partial [Pseudomonadota bacterium]|nr:hypothetical protein [Pseudomonadota bacterium]
MPKYSDKKTFKLGNNIFDLIAGHISNLVSSKPEEYIKSNMFTDLNRYQRSSKERRILIANDFSIVKKDAETLDENKLQKKFESILEQPDLRKELFRNQAQTSVATWSQLSVRDSTDRSDFMYGNVEDCLYIYFTKDDNNNPIMRTRRFVGLNYSENLLKQQSLYLDHAGGIRVSSLEDFRYIKSTSLDVDRRLVDVFEEVDYIYKYRAIGDVIDILDMSLDENVIDERLSEFSKDNHDYVLQAYRDPQKKQVEDLRDFLVAIRTSDRNDMVRYLAARLNIDETIFDDLNSNSQQDDVAININSGSNIKPIN